MTQKSFYGVFSASTITTDPFVFSFWDASCWGTDHPDNAISYKQYWYKWYHLYLLYHVRLHCQTCMYCSQQTLSCHTQVHTEVQMCYTLLDWSPKSFNRLFKQTLGTEQRISQDTNPSTPLTMLEIAKKFPFMQRLPNAIGGVIELCN